MGSLSSDGSPLTQPNNRLRHSHQGNFIRQTNTVANTGVVVITSGVVHTTNLSYPFGRGFRPENSGVYVSGMLLAERELRHNTLASGIRVLEFNKFANDSGNLAHVVTRAMGIHTSIRDRESPNSALGPMGPVARTERKVFFIDSDTGKASGLADWTIFDGSGNAVGAAAGTSDTDVTPSGF